MSISRFACHYFTPIHNDVITALKRVEKNAIKDYEYGAELNAFARNRMNRMAGELARIRAEGGEASARLTTLLKNTADYDEAENAASRLGLPSLEDTVMEKFLRGVYPKTVVIKYPKHISAFPYAPKDDPYNYSGWLKFNTNKNCHPQKHGGLLVVEESSGERRVEFWKQGCAIQAIEFCKTGVIAEGDVSDFFDAVSDYVDGFEHAEIKDAKEIARGENAFNCIEDIFGFPLLLDSLTGFPANCVLLDETRLMRIFRKCL